MALYSKEHNFLFFHIPRCGGSSIQAILDNCRVPYEQIGQRHCSAQECFQEFIQLGRAEDFYEADKFAFVRSPYHWVISLYEHIIHNRSHCHYYEIRNFSFRDFVSWLLPAIKNRRTAPFGRYMMQHEFLCNADNTMYLMRTGKVDTFNRDAVTILKEFNIIPDVIPKHNAISYSDNGMSRYDDVLLEKMNDFFSKDFELFNFAKL